MDIHVLQDVRLLGPLMTTIGICISILLWNLNQRRKSLSYTILWRHPLLNFKGVARDQLDIRFRGENVSSSQLVVIRMFNSGHLPINLSDYQTDLSIKLNPGAQILDAHVIETMPADLEERFKDPEKTLVERLDAEKIVIRPILLNAGDSFTIQVLASNLIGNISIAGHVQGISRVDVWRENRVFPTVLTHFGAIVMAVAMLGVRPSDLVSLQFEHVLPWMLGFLLGYVFLSAGISWPRKSEGSFV